MANFYCKWCGKKFPSVQSLTSYSCNKNPNGAKHELYEGDEKSKYTCKFCGREFSSISSMVDYSCNNSLLKNINHHCNSDLTQRYKSLV